MKYAGAAFKGSFKGSLKGVLQGLGLALFSARKLDANYASILWTLPPPPTQQQLDNNSKKCVKGP